MSRDPYWGTGHAGGGCGDGCLDVGIFWTFPFSVDPVAGVAGYFLGNKDRFRPRSSCLFASIYTLQSTQWEYHADSGKPYRVKTGYVTNKVIGVDGGLFAQ